MTNWHRLEQAELLRELGADAENGLPLDEASRRLARSGRNEIHGAGSRGPWQILWQQLTALMVVILIVAAAISALLGDYKDAAAIAAIVVLNAVLGFLQEYRAEKAMAALQHLSVPSSRVRRDGRTIEISSSEIVPGDLVFLEAGNFVAADGRIVEEFGLQTQEAALTGESEPVRKQTEKLDQDNLPLGDRLNMVYRGTFVTAGRGALVVTATGMDTELGRIATLMQTVGSEWTPLQKRLHQLGRGLAATALLLVAVIFAMGVLRGEDLQLMLLTAVSIGVAAVPEGLPAVVTIALTLGAQRMLKRKVLIRRLSAVETLGSVTVICSDKTGTLTENRMTAAQLHVAGHAEDVAGIAEPALDALSPTFQVLLAGGALCNDAVLPAAGEGLGDPTEVALASVAAKYALRRDRLETLLPRIAEAPFDAVRKRMTTVHRVLPDLAALPGGLSALLASFPSQPAIAFTKGSVDGLLGIAASVWAGGRLQPMDAHWRQRIERANEELAGKGMRVLGLAVRAVPEPGADAVACEREMSFIGMVGIIDPPRQEVAAAVATCREAGVRPVMITGDHPLTASYIAAQLGISGDAPALTGIDLERMPAAELEQLAEVTPVYARVAPEQKLKIVQALQHRGHVVAMTGDGVNDAPALKKADIGIAMGITGTDVAKEAADMVLLDDNFTSIVAAVEEGRVIYDNLRKFIKYMLATNSGEIWLMLLAPFAGMPLPLLPLQLLWLNLVTDGLPALALAVEPAETAVMRRPPHPPSESIFARGLGWHVLWVGLLMAALSLGAGFFYWRNNDPKWQTMVFTIVTFAQMAHVMAIRSERESLFRMGIASNRPMLGAVALTCSLQVALIYVPVLQDFFHTRALPAADFALAVVLSLVIFAAVEFEKWRVRRRGL
jgi:Ca2+-transporting ATPase